MHTAKDLTLTFEVKFTRFVFWEKFCSKKVIRMYIYIHDKPTILISLWSIRMGIETIKYFKPFKPVVSETASYKLQDVG